MKYFVNIFSVHSIQTKLILTIIFLVVIPIISIDLIYLKNSEKFVQERIQEANEQMLGLASSRIDSFMNDMVVASNTVCFDKQVIEILSRKTKSGLFPDYLDIVKIEESISRTQNTVLLNIFSYLRVFDLNGEVISVLSSPNENLENFADGKAILNDVINKDGGVKWIAPHIKKNVNGDSVATSAFITLGRLIHGSGGQGNHGILTISIDEQQFYKKFFLGINDFLDNEDFFLINEAGEIITHTNRQLVGTYSPEYLVDSIKSKTRNYFIEGKGRDKKLVSWKEIGNAQWFLVKTSNYDQMFSELSSMKNKNFTFILIVLIAFIFVTTMISYGITVPIKKLRKLIKKVEEGNMEARATFEGKDEVAQLGRSFNQMISKVNELIRNIKSEQKMKDELRLELMQAQINPHFIFNTLNAIKWTAMINHAVNTAELLEDFGRIIGMSIKEVDKLITLDEEISNLKSYLNIQKARFNYPFKETLQIAEDVHTCNIPKLMLQPLVENSIMHGFGNSFDQCLNVKIIAYREEKNLIIEVTDDGIGISRERLGQIMADALENSHKSRFNGIGLQNVHKRVQMIFGDEYGLKIDSQEGLGTTVKLVLPFIQEDNNHGQSDDCR